MDVFAREGTFGAGLEGLGSGAAFLEEALAAGSCPPAVANRFQIAFDEIASNIVRYSGAETFDVRVTREGEVWTVACSDDGVPWNPLEHADPDTTLAAEDRPIGGLGLLMVKKLMDEVVYAQVAGRNVLTLRKGAA